MNKTDLTCYYDVGTGGGFGPNGHSADGIWVASQGYFAFWYDDANNSNYLTYRTITPDYGNNTFTLGAKTVLSSTNITSSSGGRQRGVIYDYDRDRMVATFGSTDRGTFAWELFPISTVSQWIGINTTAKNDGETATITLPGGVNEQQSGMTIEGTYYVEPNDGTITASAGTEIGGVALSATKLLVADNTANVGSFATTASSATKADLASPTFTGTPAAPTAAVGTNTTQIATTAFVLANAGDTYSEITSATTAVAGNVYIINTGAAVTLTLPASASIGDKVGVIDGTGQAATNNITIGRNSHKIQGDAADMTVSLNRAAFELVYYNATHGWLLTKV